MVWSRGCTGTSNNSFNGRVSEKLVQGYLIMIKMDIILKGVKLTYAYHLMFSRDEIDLNQLSFGISEFDSESS
jgi:hypothetical protein